MSKDIPIETFLVWQGTQKDVVSVYVMMLFVLVMLKDFKTCYRVVVLTLDVVAVALLVQKRVLVIGGISVQTGGL